MNKYYSNSSKPEAIGHRTSEELINEHETLKTKESHIPLQLEDIINTGPAVFFLWSIEKNWPVDLVSANVNQFGYSAEEFLNGNLPYSAIVFPDDLNRISDALNTDIQEGSLNPLILEYRLLTKAKEIRWIDDRRVARRNDHGQITHYQGVIIDITHRKRMEEEILKAEKLESFEIMASGIAHDFNNMLSVILGNINFAKMIIKAEDPANKKLTEAEIACGRAKELAQH
jgi:PAS domain S-box-containing protein